MRQFVYGAECELGYGFNSGIHHFVKSDGVPKKVDSQAVVQEFVTTSSALHSGNAMSHYLGGFLDGAFLKMLQFHTVCDELTYNRFKLLVVTRHSTCSKVSELPKNSDSWVCKLEYGLVMDVMAPAAGFPESADQMSELLTLAVKDAKKLTKEQKEARCRVLIGFKEERQMTLEQVFEFKADYVLGKHRGFEAAIIADFKQIGNASPLAQAQPQTVNRKLINFLTFLYVTYSKIERILEKAGYPHKAPLQAATPKSIARMCTDLENAKNGFRLMDTTRYTQMYTCLRELFQRYQDYLRAVVDGRLQLDEEDHLPCEYDKFVPWMRQLNTWNVVKFGDVWFENYGKLLVTPPGLDDLKALLVFKAGVPVIERDTFDEPHLLLHAAGIQGKFGCVDMSAAVPDDGFEAREGAVHLKSKCPEGCTDDVRGWICSACGSPVKIHMITVHCKCGSQTFDRSMLVCNHPSHLPQDVEETLEKIQLDEKNDEEVDGVEVVEKEEEMDNLEEDTVLIQSEDDALSGSADSSSDQLVF